MKNAAWPAALRALSLFLLVAGLMNLVSTPRAWASSKSDGAGFLLLEVFKRSRLTQPDLAFSCLSSMARHEIYSLTFYDNGDARALVKTSDDYDCRPVDPREILAENRCLEDSLIELIKEVETIRSSEVWQKGDLITASIYSKVGETHFEEEGWFSWARNLTDISVSASTSRAACDLGIEVSYKRYSEEQKEHIVLERWTYDSDAEDI